MTDPKFEVGEAAARAPRLEPDDLAHDARVQAVHQRLCARAQAVGSHIVALEEAAEEIVNLSADVEAARAPREPLELPADIEPLRPVVEELLHRMQTGRGEEALYGPEVRCQQDIIDRFTWCAERMSEAQIVRALALAASRSALPPTTKYEDLDPRVGPSVPRVETIGSTAEVSPGNATAAERTDPAIDDIWKASDGRRLRVVSVEPQRGRVGCRNVDTNRLSYVRIMFFRGARDGNWSIEREDTSAALPRVPEPDLLAAWREQDRALQDIYGECGEDAPIGCPGDVFALVKRTLAELRATAARAPEPDLVEALEIAIDVLRMCQSNLVGHEAYIDAAIYGGEQAVRASRAGAEAPPDQPAESLHFVRDPMSHYNRGYDIGFAEGQRAALAGAELPTHRFDCATCGPGIAVDEDGCCRTCGADARSVNAVRAGAEAPPKVELDPQEVPYERIDSQRLCAAIRLRDGERLLVLQPFGWHIDGRHIPNAAEHFSREGVCEEHGWTVVCELGPHIAIVRAGRAGHLEPTVCTEAEFQVQRADEERLTELFNAGYEAGKRAARAEPPRCTWEEDEDGVWRTSCDEEWFFEGAGAPSDHQARFCFYCGLPITANSYAARASRPRRPKSDDRGTRTQRAPDRLV